MQFKWVGTQQRVGFTAQSAPTGNAMEAQRGEARFGPDLRAQN